MVTRRELMERAESICHETISSVVALGDITFGELMHEHKNDGEAAACELAAQWLRDAADELEEEDEGEYDFE